MWIVKVKNELTKTVQRSDFKTYDEAVKHFETYRKIGYWGNDEIKVKHPKVELKHAKKDAVLDKDGNILEAEVPERFETIEEYEEVIPSEYSYEIIEVDDLYDPISPRQIRLALLSIGIRETDVETAINSLDEADREAANIAWRYSNEFQRNIPMVEVMGAMLGLTKEQLNNLWSTAIKL